MSLPLLSQSRGIGNLVSRIGTIISRFGLTSGKFEKLLRKFNVITRNLDCVPTFPITAKVLQRNPKLIRKLSKNGVEFAIHGYIHIDHKALSFEEQVTHYKKAISVFQACQVPYTGFRAPFLRTNEDTARALSRLYFTYDSSRAVNWHVVHRAGHSETALAEYERLVEFYQAQSAEEITVLPRLNNGIVEIPVCIPDDEAMVERLGIKDIREMRKIWGDILQKTYSRGELFTIQLHPERINECQPALANVIHRAKIYQPPVWIATLREISAWWREKAEFTFDIQEQGTGGFNVHANCSDRAAILVKNGNVYAPAKEWSSGYQLVTDRDFRLESPLRPVVGVAPETCEEAMDFLKSDGFIVEKSERPEKYGIYLENLARFEEKDKRIVLERIDHANVTLLRYWRWPYGTRMALTVTGDIDSITLFDFVFRIYENWRQKRHNLDH
jgi:hypothetical protein